MVKYKRRIIFVLTLVTKILEPFIDEFLTVIKSFHNLV